MRRCFFIITSAFAGVSFYEDGIDDPPQGGDGRNDLKNREYHVRSPTHRAVASFKSSLL
jgi:hypothetical protein